MSHPDPKYRLRSFFAVLLACSWSSFAAAESWTDLNNTRTIEAEMLGLWNDSVVLLLDDGRRVTVNLSALKAESRIQAQRLAAEKKTFRTGMVNEIKGKAKAASAPAPNPIPKPPAAPAYVQPQPNTPIIQHLQMIDDQVRAGHIITYFDALPPSYRQGVSDLVKLGARKIDATSFQGLMGSIHKIGDVIVTRQRWVFSHPRLESMGADAEPIEEVVLLLAGFLRDGFNPAAMDLNQLETTPFRDWLMQRDLAMAPYIAELNSFAGSFSQPSYELVSEQGDVAKVKTTVGQVTSTVDFANIEGFWIPKEWSDKWEENIAKTRSEIERTPNGTLMNDPMTAMIPQMIQGVIQPLASAADSKSFHAAMENLFAQAQPAVTSMVQLAGMNMPGDRRRGGGFEGNGYDEYDESMEEMYEEGMEEMDDYETQMQQGSGPPAGGRGTRGGPPSGSSGPPGGARGGSSGGPPGGGSSRPPAGSSSGPAGGYGSGSSSPNPNIGARLEDDMRRRNEDMSRQQRQ